MSSPWDEVDKAASVALLRVQLLEATNAAGRERQRADRAESLSDAALEVLRPFARLGAEMRKRGAAQLDTASWPLLIASDFVEGLNGGSGMRLHSAHCLAALEFWQSHRPGVEP